jgi:hypothetical protein
MYATLSSASISVEAEVKMDIDINMCSARSATTYLDSSE